MAQVAMFDVILRRCNLSRRLLQLTEPYGICFEDVRSCVVVILRRTGQRRSDHNVALNSTNG